jgi:hypothetical protein
MMGAMRSFSRSTQFKGAQKNKKPLVAILTARTSPKPPKGKQGEVTAWGATHV